ncbi:MAG: hypothetical protein RL151_246 [Bacteroidota bacterium]|jgi:hypothetical protein
MFRLIIMTFLMCSALAGCTRSDNASVETPEPAPAVFNGAILDINGLPYHTYDEAGLKPRAIILARMIASTDYCRQQVMGACKSAAATGLNLGFDAGPEMGAGTPSPVYRYRLFRDCEEMTQTFDWFFFDPETESLYVEDLANGNHRKLQIDPLLLADFRADKVSTTSKIYYAAQ